MAYFSCTEITDDLIPRNGVIVFDWDNTLKIYDRIQKKIHARVEKSILQHWKTDKKCDMYIISAINPSRINLETLLLELERVCLLELFTKKDDKVEVKSGFARKGNVIICGYDKAEMFLKVMEEKQENDFSFEAKSVEPAVDVVDSRVECDAKTLNSREGSPEIVFFDDEEINIINFSAIVKNSKCFLVK